MAAETLGSGPAALALVEKSKRTPRGPSCARAARVAELFGSRAPAQAVEVTEAMARLLLGAACLPTRGRPTNTQLVLNASRAALMRLGPRGHALTMSVVKQILVAAQR